MQGPAQACIPLPSARLSLATSLQLSSEYLPSCPLWSSLTEVGGSHPTPGGGSGLSSKEVAWRAGTAQLRLGAGGLGHFDWLCAHDLGCPQVEVHSLGTLSKDSHVQVQGVRRGRDNWPPRVAVKPQARGDRGPPLKSWLWTSLLPRWLQGLCGGRRACWREQSDLAAPALCHPVASGAPALPCPVNGPGRTPLQAGLYVNQGLISPSGICVEYHFFNYRPWAGLAAACCGANYHKSRGNN